jgi:cytochrome d ubiquinol oxidase subunit I
MRTSEAISPVPGGSIALTLAAFILVYGFIFGAGSYFILKLIGKGPDLQGDPYGSHGLKKPPLVAEMLPEKGGQHVQL